MSIDVDLRSDTVTKPSAAMRRAMAEAEVGDDVLGHDPTMQRLEEAVAELTGKAAALWVPSGCMSNLVALMGHLDRGQRFLAPRHAHILSHELGNAAWLAGGIPSELPWALGPGVPAPDDVRREATEMPPTGNYYELVTTLLCLENTHNHAGGTIVPLGVYRELVDTAHACGLAVHLDGARIWHAAAALGVSVADAVGAADTVSVCLSKGLGAPIGSVLAGPAEFIARARRHRKMLGGGVRQGGVVAAAGLVALETELPRIDEDRQRAFRLAAGLRELGYQVAEPETNMVFVEAAPEYPGGAKALAERWNAAGVGCFTMGPAVRLVTHRDVDDAAITRALALIANA